MMTECQVLHFCPLPSFSGLEQYALKLAVESRARGVEACFVVLKGSELETECSKAGVPAFVVDFPYEKSLFSAAGQYAKILRALPNLKLIHLHSSQDIDRIGLALLRVRVRPKVIQQNHVWISHGKNDPIHWITHKVLDEIWCSSEKAREDLERFLPVPKSKIHVIRYGRDLNIVQTFSPRESARAELGLPSDALVLGAIARIDKGKGIWELLQASTQLMDEGADFHLVVIGGPTLTDPASIEFSKKVTEFVETLPPRIRERVKLTGGIPNAGRLLKAFDLYAQVAYKETFSLALLDAQLAELPVIGTASGGTPEVVREGSTGWLAKPEDIPTLKAAIKTSLNHRASWKAFGQRARARVEREFDINVIVPEIIRRYSIS